MNTSGYWHNATQATQGRLSQFFAVRWVSGILQKKATRPSPKPIPSNLYHRCNETPLSVFITCLVERNYAVLIRHGKARPDDTTRAWESIYSEYSDISGNPTSKILIGLSKDIAYHDAKLRSVGLCLKVLQHHADPSCIRVLRSYGYNYAFDISNPQQYARDIEAVAARTGNIVMTLKLKKAEYDRESEKVTGKPMTRLDWDKILAVLFEHYHARINPSEVTVSEFVALRKRYEAEMIALRRETERRKQMPNLRNIG